MSWESHYTYIKWLLFKWFSSCVPFTLSLFFYRFCTIFVPFYNLERNCNSRSTMAPTGTVLLFWGITRLFLITGSSLTEPDCSVVPFAMQNNFEINKRTPSVFLYHAIFDFSKNLLWITPGVFLKGTSRCSSDLRLWYLITVHSVNAAIIMHNLLTTRTFRWFTIQNLCSSYPFFDLPRPSASLDAQEEEQKRQNTTSDLKETVNDLAFLIFFVLLVPNASQ